MKKLLLIVGVMFYCIGASAQLQYTFTPAGATGQFGPSQTDVNTAYTGTALAGQVTVVGGIQYWVVPQSGYYSIQALGAQGFGPFGGRGADMYGEFTLTAGDTLKILVGQKGAPPVGAGTNQYGGGGGSFVTTTNNTPLIVAGGGGGSWATSYTATTDASITTSGNTAANAPTNGAGGTNGSGGAAAASAGGGGGLTGDGGLPNYGGLAFINGGTGGKATTNGGEGGFGGGGGANSWDNRRGGGGGGYSGGGGAGSSTTALLEGGGGGSFNSGLNPVNTAGVQLGDGQVVISPLSSGMSNDIGIVSIDAPFNFCAGTRSVLTTVQNFGSNVVTTATINWSVNGVVQTPFSFTGTLDTIGGSGSVSAQVTVGSYNFLASTPYNIRIWSSLPNGVADNVNSNDTVTSIRQSGLIAPTGLAASNVTTTAATVSWNPLGGAGYVLEYGVTGFTLGTGNRKTGVGTSRGLTNLLGNTIYDVYLADSCGANDIGAFAGPITFRTPCIIASSPFSESFDSPSWVPRTGIDPCWSTSPSAGSTWSWEPRPNGPTSGNGPLNDISGGNFMYCEASISGTLPDAELISPPIDVSNLNTPALYFFQHRYSGATIADMSIEVSNDFGTTWNNEYTIAGDIQASSSDPWVLEFVNLASYTGDTVMIKFKQKFNGCCGDAAIDSVVIDEAPTCPWPVGLSVSGVTDSSAMAHWNDPSGTKWDVFWGPSGFQQGSPGTFSMTTSTNPDTLGGLLPNTVYDFYVRANCLDSASGVSLLIGPFTFRTACTPFSAPYSDNFDSYPTNITPYCWSFTQTGGRTTVGQAYTYTFNTPNSAPNHIYFYNGNPAGPGDTTLFISPKFSDITASDKRVQFNAKASGTNSVVVGTMSDPMDMLSFNPIDTVSLTTAYSLHVVDLTAANGYNGTDSYVAFRHGNGGTFTTIYLDDFVYEQIPLCNPPFLNTLGVDAATTTANVYWGPGTDGDVSHFEVGTVGFTPGTSTAVFAGSVAGTVDTGLVTGLTAQTTYEYYMRDSCNANGFSPWIGPITFTTQCVSATMPYYESFDVWPLACWDVNGGTQPWVEYVGASDSYAEASFWSFNVGNDMVMTSRPVTLARDAQIRFYWSHQYQTFYPDDELIVRAKILGGQWDTLLTLKGPNNFNDPTAQATSPGSFVEEEILLDALVYTGHDVIVELRANSGFGPDLFINDFYIEDAPLCPNVANLAAGSITDSSAMLSWMGNPNAGSYQVWFGPQGFFQGTQTVGGARSVGTTTSLLVDTLTDNSCYEFLIRGICGPGDTSQWIGPVTFCTPCLPFNAPYQESFDNWPLSCWDLTGSQTWGNFAGPGTDQYARANFWSWSSGEAIMTSPIINLNAQQAEVEFEWSHLYSASYPDDQIVVMVNKVGTSIMDTIIDLKGPGNFNDPTAGNTTPGNFIKENLLIDSATYANSSIRVIFRANTDFGPDAYVNNFKVKYPVSNDVHLFSGSFERDGKCLTNNDTIVLQARNILGNAINFTTNPLVANYSVTGPVNTSGTITVNTGTLPAGDTVSMMATNIDMSQPGIYTLNAYINPNPTNLDGLNDTLYSNVSIQVYEVWEVTPDTVVVITNSIDTVELEAKSPFFGGGGFFISEICHFKTATGAPAGGWPTYLTADDYIEITGVPNSDLGGYVLEQWGTASLTNTHTFPAGTLIGPNGTAIVAVGSFGSSVPSPANFYYHANGAFGHSSGSAQGRVIKDPNGVIVDAAIYGVYTFPAISGVTAADWTGSVPTSTSTSGIRLEGPDLNSSTGWVASATSPQNPNTVNANVQIPAAGGVSGFAWTLNSSVIDTLPKTVVGPYTTSGVYNYIASFVGPCGVFSDTVTVIVNLPGSCPTPTNLAANVIACDSVEISWNTSSDSAIVAYVATGGTPGTGTLVVGDSSLTITGTSANTTYDYYVSNICKGDTGNVAGPFTFSTGNVGAPVAICSVQQQGFSLLVSFDGSTSTGDGNTYVWDFGDGNTGTGANTTHTYTSGGSKTITLIVTNACGADTTTCSLPANFSYGENTLLRSMVIFPNPAKDEVKVSFDAIGSGEMTLRLLDITGKEIISEEYDNLNGRVDQIINIGNLADGVYMIEVSNGELKAVKRLIKQ